MLHLQSAKSPNPTISCFIYSSVLCHWMCMHGAYTVLLNPSAIYILMTLPAITLYMHAANRRKRKRTKIIGPVSMSTNYIRTWRMNFKVKVLKIFIKEPTAQFSTLVVHWSPEENIAAYHQNILYSKTLTIKMLFLSFFHWANIWSYMHFQQSVKQIMLW